MNIKVFARGVLVSAVITLVGILVMSFAMYKFRLGDAVLGFPVVAIYGLAAFGGGLVTGKRAPSRRFLWGLIYGLIFFVLMLLISLLTAGGIERELGQLVMIACVCAGGGMLGGMIA